MAVAEDLEVASFLKGQPKKLFIGGRWVDAASGKTFETVDPATGEVLALVAEAGAEDVARAVAAARKSFDRSAWPETPPAEQTKGTGKVGNRHEARPHGFARPEPPENGMPINGRLLSPLPLPT